MRLISNRYQHPARGLTLVECMVFVSIWASVSITSLYALQEYSFMRGQAKHRAELALVAQSELERARALPASELQPGAVLRDPADWWPTNTSCTVTLAPRSATTWEITVQAGRDIARGVRPVTLTSVRRTSP